MAAEECPVQRARTQLTRWLHAEGDLPPQARLAAETALALLDQVADGVAPQDVVERLDGLARQAPLAGAEGPAGRSPMSSTGCSAARAGKPSRATSAPAPAPRASASG